MEIAEIRLHCGKQEDLSPAPLEQVMFLCAFLDRTIDDFAKKHRHRILIYIIPDAEKRMTRSQISCCIKSGFCGFRDFRLKDIQRQQKRHYLLSGTTHKETPPSVIPAEGVDDDGILPELGRMEDYQFRAGCHLFSESHLAIARRAFPLWDILFFSSSEISARVIPGNSSAMKIGSYPKPPLPDFS